jgi:hypothetical protein
MLPVAQLYTRDVPVIRPPGQADLLQVLWCPFDHPDPKTVVLWRSAAAVTDVLTEPPEPPAVQDRGYVPEPCLLNPEQVTEYPDSMELSGDLQELVEEWCRQQLESAGADPDDPYEPPPEDLYRKELATAPGWKAGGWPSWGLTDPVRQSCPVCGTEMTPLLTIASVEWDDSTRNWIPYEDQERAASSTYPDSRHPTMIQIGDNYDLQIYACPASPEHPHTEQVQ